MIAVLLVTAGFLHAAPLHMAFLPSIASGGSCVTNRPATQTLDSSFNLPGLSGPATFISTQSSSNQPTTLYTYGIDLNQVHGGQGTHCLRLVMNFGVPEFCDFDSDGIPDQVLAVTSGPGVASADWYAGQIAFQFGPQSSPCLSPPGTVQFAMFSDQKPVTNFVTIIDRYTDPATGTPVEAIITVRALLPLSPPPIAILPQSMPSFQGALKGGGNHSTPLEGMFDFSMQLFDSPQNGFALTDPGTGAVQVAGGLFQTSLPFEAASYFGQPRWLDIAVRPTGSNMPFTALGPRLPLSPAPQAIYAYTAGSVASLSPGQGVTSLNGLTDDVLLQSGPGIALRTNGNTIMIMTAGTPIPAPASALVKSSKLSESEPALESLQLQIRALQRRIEALERHDPNR